MIFSFTGSFSSLQTHYDLATRTLLICFIPPFLHPSTFSFHNHSLGPYFKPTIAQDSLHTHPSTSIGCICCYLVSVLYWPLFITWLVLTVGAYEEEALSWGWGGKRHIQEGDHCEPIRPPGREGPTPHRTTFPSCWVVNKSPGCQQEQGVYQLGSPALWLLGIFWRDRSRRQGQDLCRIACAAGTQLTTVPTILCPPPHSRFLHTPSEKGSAWGPGSWAEQPTLHMGCSRLVCFVGHLFSARGGEQLQATLVAVMLSGPNGFLWVSISALLFMKPETCAGAAPVGAEKRTPRKEKEKTPEAGLEDTA